MNMEQQHNFSHCVEFTDADFSKPGFREGTYEQTDHFDRFAWGNAVTYPTCFTGDGAEVLPFTQNKSKLITEINAMQPSAQTSIFLGMKWGLALLDPTARDIVAAEADPVFVGRPAEYPVDGDKSTTKIVVLMTDGQNTSTFKMRDEFYNSPNLVHHFGTNPISTWMGKNYRRNRGQTDIIEQRYSWNEGDRLLKESCETAAAQNVQVYAIAFSAPKAGVRAMADCASTANHFFDADGSELESIFESIAYRVSDLRLTQ